MKDGTLINKDGETLSEGDSVTTFRGQKGILESWSEAQGRVYVRFPEYTNAQSYFPSVINAKFEEPA